MNEQVEKNMNHKNWLIVLAVLFVISLIGNGYLVYRISHEDEPTQNTSTTTDTKQNNSVVNNSSVDEDSSSQNANATKDSNADSNAENDSRMGESTALGITFSYPAGWYWGSSNTKLVMSNKANYKEINLGNAPKDFQAIYFDLDRGGNEADSVKNDAEVDTIQTADGVSVPLYVTYTEGGGLVMTGVWKSPNGTVYYATTGAPNSDFSGEIAALKEVIATIKHK